MSDRPTILPPEPEPPHTLTVYRRDGLPPLHMTFDLPPLGDADPLTYAEQLRDALDVDPDRPRYTPTVLTEDGVVALSVATIEVDYVTIGRAFPPLLTGVPSEADMTRARARFLGEEGR